ncbi:MAG: thiamine-phosphate synthase [Candidatus Diapherotrites archaeon]|nr:thiamine-phosphate synthase [Candidatus Diapherotrites archaeon]
MNILDELNQAVEIIKKTPAFCKLIPEVGTNIAYAKPDAKTIDDVAAIPGRIREALGKPSTVESAHFGVSSHMARTCLKAIQFDPNKRCCMNIRYSEENIEQLREHGYSIFFFDRMNEPENIKQKEGASIPWIVEQAYKGLGYIPDIIYDKGAVGKEPMIRIFAENPRKAVEIALSIL